MTRIVVAGGGAAVRARSGQLLQRGFTLLELLVVMTLLSVIMAGLVSALRSMAQTEGRIDQRLERLDDARVARAFLQQILSRVSAEMVDATGQPGVKTLPFVATKDSLTWVGILPARPNLGGRYYFRLTADDTNEGRQLVLRLAHWNNSNQMPDWSRAESRVMVKGVAHFGVQAQGLPVQSAGSSEPWPSGWQSGWPHSSVLPERIRFQLVDAQGEWPEWNIALHALPRGDNGFSRVTIGGAVK